MVIFWKKKFKTRLVTGDVIPCYANNTCSVVLYGGEEASGVGELGLKQTLGS